MLLLWAWLTLPCAAVPPSSLCSGINCEKGTICMVHQAQPHCVTESQGCHTVQCPEGTGCEIIWGIASCITYAQSCHHISCQDGMICELLDGVPRCVAPPPSCASIHCKENTICVMMNNIPQCIPVPSCQHFSCPSGTVCDVVSWWPVCVPVQPSCDQVSCSDGTVCEIVQGQPQCVLVPASCSVLLCERGTTCQIVSGHPKCVPVPSSCRDITCAVGEACEMEGDLLRCRPIPTSCDQIHCKLGTMCELVNDTPSCVSILPSCNRVECNAGSTCEMIDSWPNCVPAMPLPSCGGIECKSGTTCETVDGQARCVPSPLSCDKVICKVGTVCHAVDGFPKCVPMLPSCDRVQCPPETICTITDGWPTCVPTPPSCDGYLCKEGTVCRVVDNWPKCVPIPASCDNVRCVEGTVCQMVDSWPKCVSTPPTCGKYQCKEGTVCEMVDSWPKCVPVPSCDKYQCKAGMTCEIVDNWPKCIPILASCDRYKCKSGTVCHVLDGLPKCIPMPQSCANYHCSEGTVCDVLDGFPKCISITQSCGNYPCNMGTICQVVDGLPRCVPIPQSCASLHCDEGTTCQVIDGFPKCVPIPQSCANYDCVVGTVCHVVGGFPKCIRTPPSCVNHDCDGGTLCQVVDGLPKCVPFPRPCASLHCDEETICQVIDGFPKCVPIPQSCANYDCVVGSVCHLIGGFPKCIPIPQSCVNHHCDGGTICQVVDRLPKCVPFPQSCANFHCNVGTMCHVVDGLPKCVPTPKSCANHDCKMGTLCQVVNGLPKCVPIPQSCANHHCTVGTICQAIDGLPKCIPIPQSCANNHCAVGTICQVVDGLPKCVPIPQSCANLHCTVGTICQVVDELPKCVPFPQSCANHHCNGGTICHIIEGLPKCVPSTQSCANHRCDGGTICHIIDGLPKCVPYPESCANHHCNVGAVCQVLNGLPKCVPIPQSCANHYCNVGNICQVVNGLPKCVPIPQTCANHQCPVGTKCHVVDGFPKCIPVPQSCASLQCKEGTVCNLVDGRPQCVHVSASCRSTHCKQGTVCHVISGWPRCVEATQTCSTMHCSSGMTCVVKDGLPKCVPVFPTQSACWASGESHYHTFDGRSYNFQGTCAYTVAKTCKPNSKLPFFHVFTKSQRSSSIPFSLGSQVTLIVYSYSITMVKYEYGLVRVNQVRSHLPMSLHEGKLTLYHRGSQLVIETGFGLHVYYDWNNYLVVKATAAFQGHVCGLCGNYNGDPNDDFVTSSGGLATNSVEFGKSWKVEDGNGTCTHGCQGKCGRCSTTLLANYSTEAFCGLMAKHKDGPFHPCHSSLRYKPYVDNCVKDLCAFGGYKQILCRALKTYADACQREGAAILNWRKEAGCPLLCPENSQYVACGSACPATCNNFEAPKKCHLPCMETCECNPGYVLDSGRCLPKDRCGCIHQGHLYTPNEQFWDDQHCHRLCLCKPQDKTVICQGAQCGERSACRVDNGIRNCHAVNYSTCSTLGQLHYVTFDGLHYDFYGTCVYRLAELCHRRTSLSHFQVLVQHELGGPSDPSANKVIEVTVYGMTIVVQRSKVLLNNLLINLPYNVEHNKVSIYHHGWDVVIKTNFGMTLTFDWRNNIRLTVPGTYTGHLCGLCGNFNGNPGDDLQNRRGVSVPIPRDFGRAWKVRDIPGCTEVEKKECVDITQVALTQRKGKECGILLDQNGPFRDCHSKVPPDVFFQDCVFDYCSNRRHKNVICRIVSAYVAACQAAGAKIYEWRSLSFCRPDCPANSHYEICVSNCPVTCRSLFDQTVCGSMCHEGCECNTGFVLSCDRCVPVSQCGCLHHGFYYKEGESFYSNGFCKEQCVCHMGGIMQCRTASCGAHAECRVVDGVQTCHSLMPKTGTCHVFGDPHFLTFDGLTYDIQSNCTYILTQSCTHKHSTPSFAVHVENERRSKGKVSVTKSVSVTVYQHTFTIMRERRGFILVNGVTHSMPFRLASSGVRVYYHGDNVILQTDFGMRVSFDHFYHLAVTVPHSFQRQVCGLCGNYNDQRLDDLTIPTGDRAMSILALASSWTVNKPTVCTQDCSSFVCGSCLESRKASYVHNSQCGILQSPHGPFSACYSTISPTIFFNNCVHDLCKAQGNHVILCRAIHSYVTACQAAGVTINPWRTEQFCPMKCPANSHYELCAKACPKGCEDVTSITQCPLTCAEGCECNEGYFMAEYRCVPMSLCRCFYNGTWFKVGAMVLSAECRQQCICHRKGRVVCKPYQCSTSRSCVLSNSKWDCIWQEGHCTITHGDVFTTYDGVSGKVPSSGSYEISSLVNTTSASWFQVVAVLQKCPTCPTPVVDTVIVFFQNLNVRVNQEGLVWVNENPALLPAQPSKEVSVSQNQGVVTVAFKADVRVLLSSNREAKVILSGTLHDRVQKACGNFNGVDTDDLRLPNGTVVNSIGEVLNYCRVKTPTPQGLGKIHP